MVQPFDVAWQRTDGLDAVHELADGRLVATERDCHPDSIAEAFRRRITVLELQQIIGRGRGLWRTADNPLHVLVLTDVPLDMPVEELTTDAAERPSFEDRQIAGRRHRLRVRGTRGEGQRNLRRRGLRGGCSPSTRTPPIRPTR